MNKPIIRSAAQALKESKALSSVWSKESRLTQRILIYIVELLENPRRSRRWQQKKLSNWQKHVRKYLRNGKSIKQAAADWNTH